MNLVDQLADVITEALHPAESVTEALFDGMKDAGLDMAARAVFARNLVDHIQTVIHLLETAQAN